MPKLYFKKMVRSGRKTKGKCQNRNRKRVHFRSSQALPATEKRWLNVHILICDTKISAMALESRITQEEIKKEPEKPIDREKVEPLVFLKWASLFM